MSLISFVFIQAIHLYGSWGSILKFLFILLSVSAFPFTMMLGRLGQTSELLHCFWSLISVTVNLLVTSQLLRKLSDTLMGLSLMSDISSSPEKCSCHERSWSGRLGASIWLPRPVTCWPLKSRTETRSLNCIQLGASTESRDVSDALLMVRPAKHLQVVALCKTWISGKRRWRKKKNTWNVWLYSSDLVVLPEYPWDIKPWGRGQGTQG